MCSVLAGFSFALFVLCSIFCCIVWLWSLVNDSICYWLLTWHWFSMMSGLGMVLYEIPTDSNLTQKHRVLQCNNSKMCYFVSVKTKSFFFLLNTIYFIYKQHIEYSSVSHPFIYMWCPATNWFFCFWFCLCTLVVHVADAKYMSHMFPALSVPVPAPSHPHPHPNPHPPNDFYI